MVREIENEFLKVSVKDRGAELCGLKNKKTSIEHIWNADPKIWGRHAPLLFPIVGQVKEGKYQFGGETYKLSQHGFARDMNFELESHEENQLIFSLCSSDLTRSNYPFDFCLKVIYTLSGNKLDIAYNVDNEGVDTMWFSIGAHPGFNCPFKEGESFNEYYLELDQNETTDRICIQNGLLDGKSEVNYLKGTSQLPLTHDLFDEDAVIFEELQSSEVIIRSKKHDNFVRVNFEGWPYLGIWSKPKTNAPYVCIEPWYGITSGLEEENFINKKGICSLEAGQRFDCSYSIQAG